MSDERDNPTCPRCGKKGCPAAKDWGNHCPSDDLSTDESISKEIERLQQKYATNNAVASKQLGVAVSDIKHIIACTGIPNLTIEQTQEVQDRVSKALAEVRSEYKALVQAASDLCKVAQQNGSLYTVTSMRMETLRNALEKVTNE